MLQEFQLERGPSLIDDAHFSLEAALAAGIKLQSLPPPTEDAVMRESLTTTLAEVIGTLDPRQQLVLRARFGLEPGDGVAHTYEEIAQEIGVTRERIRQIEARALHKLRHPPFIRKLRDFLE